MQGALSHGYKDEKQFRKHKWQMDAYERISLDFGCAPSAGEWG
jgi:hypothetical protein